MPTKENILEDLMEAVGSLLTLQAKMKTYIDHTTPQDHQLFTEEPIKARIALNNAIKFHHT